MKWEILYHHEVEKDLRKIGAPAARRVLKAIDSKLCKEPLEFGQPLAGNLSGLRKLRVGDLRIVYKVFEKRIMVYVLSVGHRRNLEIYRIASSRS